ncbi:TPA: hypothetical protein I8231_001805 [Citrobacter freundii]|nr:hypothetical protein C6Q34_13980 [Citrobacter freundii]POU45883.1 hypothetical protein C3375_09335 [Citrobacter freundii complex sp. CFNIH12]AYL72749.1 hypothetical protein CUC51_19555 [Citrobacter freundii]OIY31223.1 hypothetical protein BEH69_16215 [Citrobacter freundii]RWT83804.1 hypothetical protein DN591_09590 [Citrobacter freundii]
MIIYTIAQSGWRLNVGFFAGCGVALSGIIPGTKSQVSQAETKPQKKSQQKLAKVILEAM